LFLLITIVANMLHFIFWRSVLPPNFFHVLSFITPVVIIYCEEIIFALLQLCLVNIVSKTIFYYRSRRTSC